MSEANDPEAIPKEESFGDSIDRTIKYVEKLFAENQRMRKALNKIAKWHGEFPSTGEFQYPGGAELSYAICYGSNGERDFMRKVAREALEKE